MATDIQLNTRYTLLGSPHLTDEERHVWKARDLVRLGDVAIKASLPVDGQPPHRLIDEYNLMRRLPHPALVHPLELAFDPTWGNHRGLYYFSLPWIDGPSVRSHRGTFRREELDDLARQLLGLVHWLHEADLVALDLKSDHLLRQGRVWRLIDLEQGRRPDLLRQNRVEGTLLYLAPQQLQGEPADHLSDLFAAGLILYEAAQGQLPDWSMVDVQGRALNIQLKPVTPPAIMSDSLKQVVRGLLAYETSQRIPSAAAALKLLGGPGEGVSALPRSTSILNNPLGDRLASLRSAARTEGGGGSFVLSSVGGGLSNTLHNLLVAEIATGKKALYLKSRELGRPGALVEQLLTWLKTRPTRHSAGRRSTLTSLSDLRRAGQEYLKDPVLVLIDDMHLLPDEDRAVILKLLPFLPESGLFLVVGVQRDRDEALAQHLMAELPVVLVPPLSLDQVRQLCDELLTPGVVREPEATHLHEVCRGLPAPLMEALDQRRLDPTLDLTRWRPTSVQEWTTHTLQHLSPTGQLAASWLSLVPQLHREIVPLMPPIQEGLAELEQVGLISLQDNYFRWVESSYRQVVHGNLNPEEYTGAALTLARTLESAGRRDLHAPAATLVDLYLEANQPQAALRWVEAMLEQTDTPPAHVISALHKLLPHLEGDLAVKLHLSVELGRRLYDADQNVEVIRLLEPWRYSIPSTPDQIRAQALLGWSLWLTGVTEEGAALLIRAGEKAEAVPGISITDRVRWSHKISWHHASFHDLEAARSELAKWDEVVDQLPLELRAQHLSVEGDLLKRTGGPTDTLMARLTSTLREATDLGALDPRQRLVHILSGLARDQHKLEDARRFGEEMVEISKQCWDLRGEAVATHNLANVMLDLVAEAPDDVDRLQQALQSYERAAALYTRLGNQAQRTHSELWRCSLLAEHGHPDDATAELNRLRNRLVQQAALTPALDLHLELLNLRLQLRRGESRDLVSAYENLLQRLKEGDDELVYVEGAVDFMRLLLRAGDESRVLAVWSNLPDATRNRVSRRLKIRAHEFLGRAHLRLAGQGVKSGEHDVVVENQTTYWLKQIRELIKNGDQPDMVAQVVARAVGEVLGGRGLVHLVGGVRVRAASPGIRDDEARIISNSVLSIAEKTRKLVSVPDTRSHGELSNMRSVREGKARSIVCAPVLRNDIYLGAVYVDHVIGGPQWTTRAGNLAQQLAEICAGLLVSTQRRFQQSDLDPTDMLDIAGTGQAAETLRQSLRDIINLPDLEMRIFLEGDTGTGKSWLAKLIHDRRYKRPLKKKGPNEPIWETQCNLERVYCPSIPPDLVETTFYGLMDSVATGVKRFTGALEISNGGTLFIDEIHTLSKTGQATLLSPLSRPGYFRTRGLQEDTEYRAWVLCASNRDLYQLSKNDTFLPELLRRIHHNIIHVPSLRERGEDDVLEFARLFLNRYLKDSKLIGDDEPPTELETFFSNQAITVLRTHSWPWNIDEVQSLFDEGWVRRKVRQMGREKIGALELSDILQRHTAVSNPSEVRRLDGPGPSLTLKELKNWHDLRIAEYMEEVVKMYGGNKTHACTRMDCTKDTLLGYLKLLPNYARELQTRVRPTDLTSSRSNRGSNRSNRTSLNQKP